jgi:hypothetical protein
MKLFSGFVAGAVHFSCRLFHFFYLNLKPALMLGATLLSPAHALELKPDTVRAIVSFSLNTAQPHLKSATPGNYPTPDAACAAIAVLMNADPGWGGRFWNARGHWQTEGWGCVYDAERKRPSGVEALTVRGVQWLNVTVSCPPGWLPWIRIGSSMARAA